MDSNIPEYYKQLSLRLSRVLDTVGLGENIRWKKINMWIQTDEMTSVTHFGDLVFGSQAEATMTPGLRSDTDTIYPMPVTVIQNLESWVPEVETLLLVSDENTPPGYAKLQFLPVPGYNTKSVMYKADRYGRCCFCHDSYLFKIPFARERRGPANRYIFRNLASVDCVHAVRLHTWPYQATGWITRNRRHNWPSQATINLIQQTGALLVPVGYKESPENHLEWRLSISFGEKRLVWLFNSTQYKCYILLKIINKSFIKPIVGGDVLSSYHCKTCIFYLIESTPTVMWQPENLLLCLAQCLRLLYNWSEAATCPNYFIPDENMFQCKVYGHVQGRLLGVLRNLMSQEGRYLARISCDNTGEKLVRTCHYPLMELEIENHDVCAVMSKSFLFQMNAVQRVIHEPRTLDCLLSSQVLGLEIKAVLLKFYCSIIGSQLASECLSWEFPDHHFLDMARELLLLGSSSDVASGKLKLAAFYLVLDNLDLTENVLNEIHANYADTIYKISEQDLQSKLNEKPTISQIIRHCVAFTVVYDRSEIRCIPKALIPQMFSTAYLDIDDPHEIYLHNLASVDPHVYLHFLEFICYSRQNKTPHKNVALENMIEEIKHGVLGFIHIALNLLAYCLREEGKLKEGKLKEGKLEKKAFNVLCKSMKQKGQNNAAKWQIATLMNAAFRSRRERQ